LHEFPLFRGSQHPGSLCKIPADSSTAKRTARSVRIALAAGLALVAVAIGVVLTRPPVTVAGSNGVMAEHSVGVAQGGTTGCQAAGTVPAGTTGLRVSASVNVGPKVTARLLSGGRLITQGTRAAGWGIDESVTIPVRRVPRTIPNAQLCLTFGKSLEPVELVGEQVPITLANGRPGTTVRIRIEYLHQGHSSWWSLASTVAHRMGFGHAPSGTWIVFLLIALTITVSALASRLLLRDVR
jgi:hypothetical protein